MKNLKWKLQVTLEVSENWIEDGFDASTKESLEVMEEVLRERLPYAYDHEFKIGIKVISAPDQKVIRKLQGYEHS